MAPDGVPTIYLFKNGDLSEIDYGGGYDYDYLKESILNEGVNILTSPGGIQQISNTISGVAGTFFPKNDAANGTTTAQKKKTRSNITTSSSFDQAFADQVSAQNQGGGT